MMQEPISLTKKWQRKTRKKNGKILRVKRVLVPWTMIVMRKIQI